MDPPSDLLAPPPSQPASPMPDADSDANNNSSSNRDSGAASPEIPLTLSASVVLADLPRDATAALASAGGFPATSKVVVKFKAVGSAPALQQDVCKISAARKFEEVVRYLRRKLRCKDTDSVFLYVNSAFAPSLDEVVGNLHQCFKNAHDQLVVAYSITPAFG
ncbi:Ubiquitin-like protein [Trichoderma asperellum]|uniref:Ubiquitin-like protein n=1 Tax=Trichoderma asperellum TaxID=101201 RepID=UPI00331D58CD|nr:Ubiquitin-like protein [Trichoderma asperellum]